ncbi:MAG: ATP-grasp fold amidoligase family protein [Bacteroidota bacterium]
MGFAERLKKSIKAHKSGIRKNPVDDIAYKLKGYKLAQKQNIKTPIIYRVYKNINDVDWEELPNKFVIKPQAGCSTNGVYPLVYKGKEVYFDLLRKTTLPLKKYMKLYSEGERHSKSLWIEELLSEPLPYDWKLYAFNGNIGLIRQFNRNEKPATAKCYDTDWNEVKVFGTNYKKNHYLPKPMFPNELISTAEKLSKAVRYPFVRVDLYETVNGVYFGEITPHPAHAFQLSKEYDDYLDNLWIEAEGELNEQKNNCSNTF